jgi:ParB family chromosome partitioning protein
MPQDYTPKGKTEDLGTRYVPLSQIERNPNQPRKNFDQQKLKELAENIQQNGLLQPIVIRELQKDKYIIVAGERRFRAHQILDAETIKAGIIRCNDNVAYELSLLENIQREDINLLEEASGYLHLEEKFGYKKGELAQIVGKSPSSISNIMGILRESKSVQEYVTKGILTLAALVWIKQLPNDKEKLELLKKLEKEEIKRTQVRGYVEQIKKSYEIARKLGISVEDLEKRRNAGKGGRFDMKESVFPEDFKFFFIIDSLIGTDDLEFFPECRILCSAFTPMRSKSAAKQLARIMLKKGDTVHELMMDSGVVPAAKAKQWSFFDKVPELLQFYDAIQPDICVSLDVPAYPPILNDWGLKVDEILTRTIQNAVLFKDWKPDFETVKIYPLQGVEPEHFLWCFQQYNKIGCFEGDEKTAIAFGSIAKKPIDEIVRMTSLTLQDPEFLEVKKKLEFIHGFGIGQADRIVKLYELGINSFDALTMTIITATGQYLLRDGKYYYHIIQETPTARRIRLLFNVNSFWGLLGQKFAELKGIGKVSDAERHGVEKSMAKLETKFEGEPNV